MRRCAGRRDNVRLLHRIVLSINFNNPCLKRAKQLACVLKFNDVLSLVRTVRLIVAHMSISTFTTLTTKASLCLLMAVKLNFFFLLFKNSPWRKRHVRQRLQHWILLITTNLFTVTENGEITCFNVCIAIKTGFFVCLVWFFNKNWNVSQFHTHGHLSNVFKILYFIKRREKHAL